MAKDYYFILGVTSDASRNEIRSAYRRQAKDLHPDRSGADSEPFLDIQEAYSVLGDPERRHTYDRSRREISLDVETEPARAGSPPVEPIVPADDPVDLGEILLSRSFETFHPSFDEIFDRIRDNFRSISRPKSEDIRGLTVEIPLNREQAFRGGRARVMVPAQAACPTCRGQGGVGPFACRRCAGEGVVSGEYPVSVDFPGGITGDYTVSVPLDRAGIHNLYLTVHFRTSDWI